MILATIATGALVGVTILWLFSEREVILSHISADKREHPRHNNRSSMRVLIILPPYETLVEGWVVDRSRGGLCILVAWNIEHLEIRKPLKIKPTTGTIWSDVEIRNVVRDPAGWRVGCCFLGDVTSEIRRTFRLL
jgi:hypothetical protein